MNTRILPITYVVIFALLMYAVSVQLPQFKINVPHHVPISASLLFLAVVIIFISAVQFRSAATTTHPNKLEQTSALVSSGIYRFSRNPMYVGFLLCLVACSIYLQNMASAVFWVVFVFVITRQQIIPEEKMLEEKFGDAYRGYKTSVRRWI